MNQATSKEASSSTLSSSPPCGVSRISIGGPNISSTSAGNATTTCGNNGTGNSLMNGNGELMFRRSPISSQMPNPHQSYYTLGTPSITTSYNSEEISDNIHSSLFDDDGNLNDSLCVKVEQLQRQVELLTETQVSQDDRYKRTRQENDDLLNRIHILEDQLREIEINSETRSRDEEKRFKEKMAKQMALKSQECEQHLQVSYQLQQDIIALQKDLIKSEATIRSLKKEKEMLEADLSDKTNELSAMDGEIHRLKLLVKHMKDEESVKSNLINILNEELEENSQQRSQSERHGQFANSSSSSNNNNHDYPNTSSPKQKSTSSRRSSITSGFGDELSSSQAFNSKTQKKFDALEANLAKLSMDNKRLKEMNEELQAQLLNVQLEEGRSLIQEGNKSYSLADELGDIDIHKLMEALKHQQDDNARLRKYIDEILLKIVESHPEILDKTS